MNKIIEGACVCECCKKEFSWRCPNPFYDEKFVSINWDHANVNVKNCYKEAAGQATIELICPHCRNRNFFRMSMKDNIFTTNIDD